MRSAPGASDEARKAADLYRAVLDDLARLAERGEAPAEIESAIRGFYEQRLAACRSECARRERAHTVAARLAEVRHLIRTEPNDPRRALARAEIALHELPDEPALAAAVEEIRARIAAGATNPPRGPSEPIFAAAGRPAAVARRDGGETPPARGRGRPVVPAALPIDDEIPPPAHRVVEAASRWSSALRPFLLDNVGWFIGAFLILAGCGVLVTTFWRNIDESELLKHSIVFLGLFVTTGAFLGAAYAMRLRHRDLETSSNVLLFIASMLVPFVFATAVQTTLLRGLLPPLVGTIWGATALAGLHVAARLALGPFARASAPAYARLMAGICSVTLAAPLLRALTGSEHAATLVLAVADYAAAGILIAGIARFGGELIGGMFIDRRLAAYLVVGSLTHALLVVLTCLHLAVTASPGSQVTIPAVHYTPLLVALAGLLMFIDHRLGQANRTAPVASRLGFAAYALSLLAIAVALAPYLAGFPPAVARGALHDLEAAQALLLAAAVYGAAAWYKAAAAPLHAALFCLVAAYHVLVVRWATSAFGGASWALACFPLVAVLIHGRGRLAHAVERRARWAERRGERLDATSLAHAAPAALSRAIACLAVALGAVVLWQRFTGPAWNAPWVLITCAAYAAYAFSLARREAGFTAAYAGLALTGLALLAGLVPAFGAQSAFWVALLGLACLADAWRPECSAGRRQICLDGALIAAAVALAFGCAHAPAVSPAAASALNRAALCSAALTLALLAVPFGSRLPVYAALAVPALVAPRSIAVQALVAALLGCGLSSALLPALHRALRRLPALPREARPFGRFSLPLAAHGAELYLRPLCEVGLILGLIAVAAAPHRLAADPRGLAPVIELALAATALAATTRTHRSAPLVDLALLAAVVALHAAADRLLLSALPLPERPSAHLPLAFAAALFGWEVAERWRARPAGEGDARASAVFFAVEMHRMTRAVASVALALLAILTLVGTRNATLLSAALAAAAFFALSAGAPGGGTRLVYPFVAAVVLASLDAAALLGAAGAAADAILAGVVATLFAVAANAAGGDVVSHGVEAPGDRPQWNLALANSALALAALAAWYGIGAGEDAACAVAVLTAAAATAFLCARFRAEPALVYAGAAALWIDTYFFAALAGPQPAENAPLLAALAVVLLAAGEVSRSAAQRGGNAWCVFARPLLVSAVTLAAAAIAHAAFGWIANDATTPLVGVLGVAAVAFAFFARAEGLGVEPGSAPARVGQARASSRAAVFAAAFALQLGVATELPAGPFQQWVVSAVGVALVAVAVALRLAVRAQNDGVLLGLPATFWQRSCTAWATGAAASSLCLLAWRFCAGVALVGTRLPGQDGAALCAAAALGCVFVFAGLARCGARFGTHFAAAATAAAALWISVATGWKLPPDVALAVAGITCMAVAVRRDGDPTLRNLDGDALALLALAATATLPSAALPTPPWPSASVTFTAVVAGSALASRLRRCERRGVAAALFVLPALWCLVAWTAALSLPHPAIVLLAIALSLAYHTAGRDDAVALAPAPLAGAALRRAATILLVAATLAVPGAVALEPESAALALALVLTAAMWAATAWNPAAPALACEAGRLRSVYLAEAAAAGAYLYVRHGLLGFPFGPNMVTAGALIATSLALLASSSVLARSGSARAAVFARATYHTSLVLPLLLAVATPRTRPAITMAAFAAGAFYAIVARRPRTQWALHGAAVLFNLGLYVWLPAARQMTGLMQLYVIPAATTVLILAQLHRRDLRPPVLARVRLAAAGAILAASTLEVSFSPSLLHFTLVLGLSLIGVAAGIAARVRVIVFVAAAFLVLNVVAQLGLQLRTPAGVTRGLLLISVGVAITATMVLLNVKRSQLLRRYHAFVADPSWE
jgi:hypothetical protein